MNEERPPSPFRWITTVSFLFLIPLFGVVIWKAGEQVKQGRDFCVSCHLENGDVLHGKKNQASLVHPPGSLAGLHMTTSKGIRSSCYGCHRGTSFGEHLMTAYYEAKNTVTYLVGSFEEPKKLSRPFRDESCLPCHGSLKADATTGGYHAFAAHDGISRIQCVDCHTTHSPPEGKGYYRRTVIEAKCAACHHSPDQTFYVTEALAKKAFPKEDE